MNYKKPKNGLYTEHYDNGQIKLEISFKDGAFFGNYTTWYENGQKREERNSIDESLAIKHTYDIDYILDLKFDNHTFDNCTNGKAIYWHKNGQKQQEANFRNGNQIGRITYWYENGQIRADGNYIDSDDSSLSRGSWSPNGELIGKYKTWYENGQIESDQTLINGHQKNSILESFVVNGKSIFWFENGQKLSEMSYKNGLMHGKHTRWLENGQIVAEWHSRDDYLYGKYTTWYENGNKEKEENFKHVPNEHFGQKVGKQTYWFKSGKKASECFYSDTLNLNGVKTWWYRNGQKKSEINYKEGNFEGKYKTWYENGNKKEEGNYTVRLVINTKSSRKEGKFTLWNDDGSKKSEIHYKDGGRDGKSITWHSDGSKSEENYKNGKFTPPLLSIKDEVSLRVNSRINEGINEHLPIWFCYGNHVDKIDQKIVNHQFLIEEEEQILSLINLQELFRLVFSRDEYGLREMHAPQGIVISAEIKYNYLNEHYEPVWHTPKNLEKVINKWQYEDKNYNEYGTFDDDYAEYFQIQRITNNKLKQFYDRYEKLNISSKRHYERISQSDEYAIINTWLYTLAEDIIEQWTLKNNLEYHDYNSSNQYAPQDCRIAGVDVDVKTTTGIGRQHLKNFYRYKSEEDKAKNINEIIIGISSRTEKKRETYMSDTNSSHVILGIYDPSIYSQINLELKYFKPSSNLVNVCYFQSLESYFKTKTCLLYTSDAADE